MSKFADLLKNIHKTAIPALGFRRVEEETSKAPILLVADLTQITEKKIKELVDGNLAAAIINSSSADVNSFKRLVENLGDIPLGMVLESSNEVNIEEYITAGCDFILFDGTTPLSMVNNDKLGKMLRIEPSLAPGLARAINDLSVAIDSIMLGGEALPVTVERLLSCHFFADATGKPLAVRVDGAISQEEINSLHEAGARVMIVSGKLTKKIFNDLSKMISSLPKTSKKKSAGAILPRISMGMKAEPEEEEGEEDDDDI